MSAEMFYEMFWRDCGSKSNLSIESKIDNLCKLRDLSLKIPYWDFDETERVIISQIGKRFCQVPQLKCEECKAFKNGKCQQKLTLTDMFPQLVPSNLCHKHTHLSILTGKLLFIIHKRIFEEIKELAEL